MRVIYDLHGFQEFFTNGLLNRVFERDCDTP